LSAYERERARIAAAKQKWLDWQVNMQRDYRKIDNMDSDENLPADAKMKMWRDFLTNYSDDNPYSSEDKPIRSHARSRKSYWQNYRPPVTVTPPATSGGSWSVSEIDVRCSNRSGDSPYCSYYSVGFRCAR